MLDKCMIFVQLRREDPKSAYNSGFTLIELLVVVAVIGILAAIAIPQFNLYRARAANATANSDLRNSISAQEASMVDRELYLDCSNLGCNDPALPGMTVSVGTSIECISREEGRQFQCTTRHANGNITYSYDSENSVFSES